CRNIMSAPARMSKPSEWGSLVRSWHYSDLPGCRPSDRYQEGERTSDQATLCLADATPGQGPCNRLAFLRRRLEDNGQLVARHGDSPGHFQADIARREGRLESVLHQPVVADPIGPEIGVVSSDSASVVLA